MLVTLFQTLVLLAIIYGLSYLTMYKLAHVSRRSYRLYRLILLPGVVVHELSHTLACLLTRTSIHQISFWDETGGKVIHEKPKWPIITQPFISVAPLPVGIGLLLFL